MNKRTLVIGNKNYSSWSLRPWLFLRKNKLDFDEQVIWLDEPEFMPTVGEFKAANKVPILIDGEESVWDSLAIIETAIDRYDCQYGWPKDAKMRAHARSIASEMHSGFFDLRAECPMDIRSQHVINFSQGALADIARVSEIWTQAMALTLALSGQQGRWLYGDFCAADAMYAPVVFRLKGYGAKVSDSVRAYMDFVLADETLQPWVQAAKQETRGMNFSATD